MNRGKIYSAVGKHLFSKDGSNLATRTSRRSFFNMLSSANSSDSSSSTTKKEGMRPYPKKAQVTIPASSNIQFPKYAQNGIVHPCENIILLHDEASITKLRNAGRLAREMLEYTKSLAVEGITTDEINSIVHDEIIKRGAYPSPLNYMGFPKSICCSINEVICHGIPDSRPLQKGDIVSFDISCFLDGVHGDNCGTVIVAEDESMTTQRQLLQCAEETLAEAIQVCKPGVKLSKIGQVVHDICDAYGFDTVRKYNGHGISSDFHMPPYVKHYRNDDELVLREGMIFTIEPMITQGSCDCFEWDDRWTVVTADSGLAAQNEHMVLITKHGAEILTQYA